MVKICIRTKHISGSKDSITFQNLKDQNTPFINLKNHKYIHKQVSLDNRTMKLTQHCYLIQCFQTVLSETQKIFQALEWYSPEKQLFYRLGSLIKFLWERKKMGVRGLLLLNKLKLLETTSLVNQSVIFTKKMY